MRLEIDKLYVVDVFFSCSCPLTPGKHFLYFRGVFVDGVGGVMLRFSSSLDADAIFFNLSIYHNFFTVHDTVHERGIYEEIKM